MKILIIGAGDIGFNLARRLSKEHDITLIDNDPHKVERASEQLDALVLEGSGSSYKVLKEAGIEHTDVVAAMSNQDEGNLLACQIAKHAGGVVTIARVRNQEYIQPDFIIPHKELGVDHIIHPEKEAAEDILQLIHQSMATNVIEFVNGRIQLIGIRLTSNSPLTKAPLGRQGEEFNQLPLRIVAIKRNGMTLIPGGNDQLETDDQVFIIHDKAALAQITRLTGKRSDYMNDIMILGGGLIGQFVAQSLTPKMHVKLVESNRGKSYRIAEQVHKNCLIINGDGADIDLLITEGLVDMDAFIAATGSDETNIIATLLAKHLKVSRTIALVNNVDYVPITPTIGMDAVVSKQLLTVDAVERLIHSRQMASIASLPGMNARIVEYIASRSSKVTRCPLKDIHIPRHTIIGAVFREDHIIIPKGDTQIQPDDKVIIFTLPDFLNDVEKLFK